MVVATTRIVAFTVVMERLTILSARLPVGDVATKVMILGLTIRMASAIFTTAAT